MVDREWGDGNGPAVCPRASSLWIAFVTSTGLSRADLLLLREMFVRAPL